MAGPELASFTPKYASTKIGNSTTIPNAEATTSNKRFAIVYYSGVRSENIILGQVAGSHSLAATAADRQILLSKYGNSIAPCRGIYGNFRNRRKNRDPKPSSFLYPVHLVQTTRQSRRIND
jgi:hypothetical protein